METPKPINVWIPVCCERVMRYNVFLQKGGSAYGSMVCTTCNKSVTFELEPVTDVTAYGEGARILSFLGSPKPPKTERQRTDADSAASDLTL